MFTVARELIREDGKKVSMKIVWTATNVEVTYSLAGSQEIVVTNYTPFEAGILLDLLHIADEHQDTLND